ncbi:MAG TPA: HEPN domain-containing protein [Patescibacteria group bacterium]|nr:HEPN domain-containing protein [Patescibacteria group bacterium]
MPHSAPIPGSVADWLARARGDLALSRVPLPEGGFYEDLCFHAQQAAEKALKAVYVSRGWTFRYTHDLEELITGLQRRGIDIPEEIQQAVVLTSFAFESRYPGIGDPVTNEEYVQAVDLAASVLQWVETLVGGGQP